MGYEYRAKRSEIVMRPVRHLMVVRVDEPDEPIELPKRLRPEPVERVLRPCGTPSAYARHRRAGEPIDEACRLAEQARTADRKRRQKLGQTKPKELAPCGTSAAYNRHLRRGETVDDACRQANTELTRAKVAAQRWDTA